MKRMIRDSYDPETISIKIDVYHGCEAEDVVATDIRPVVNEMREIDPQAYADYNAFLQNLWSVVEYYGFEMYKMKTSESFPGTSKYAWVAHASEVGKKDTPLIAKVRISDHAQHLSDEHRAKIKQQDRADAEELKLPHTKKKQRFFVEDIIIDNKRYKTYEEALNAVDAIIHGWLERMNIDMSEFEDLGKW